MTFDQDMAHTDVYVSADGEVFKNSKGNSYHAAVVYKITRALSI